VLFYLMAGRCEVSMTDLDQTRTPDSNAGIDVVGWLFSVVALAIIAGAAVIAYEAHLSQIVAR
jgi:hypothetical protein